MKLARGSLQIYLLRLLDSVVLLTHMFDSGAIGVLEDGAVIWLLSLQRLCLVLFNKDERENREGISHV